MKDDPNFGVLGDEDSYQLYFNLLFCVFHLLGSSYPEAIKESYEAKIVPKYLRRLLHTVKALRVKYAYGASHDRSLWIDLTDSGFPNAEEINGMLQDFMGKKDRLRILPVKSILKRNLEDAMLVNHEAPRDLLWQLSQRAYLEMLDEKNMFLPFIPGEVVLGSEDEKRRSYIFSWACYDYRSNRPYIHLITFEQDISKQPLEEYGPSYEEFLQVVRAEGSRAPTMLVLAAQIDEAIDSIHPKMLKRICIGPLYANVLFEGG
ncbi:MAG: hypothetical protein G01um101470_695, partial [Parcubacteria group bacterium Gr01-1014_70]